MSELDNLIAQGAQIDAGIEQETAEASGQTLEVVDPANEWMIVPELLSWVITSIYPETAPAYTLEKKMQLAQAIAPVAEKYGVGGLGDSPELMLCVAAVGFGMPAYMARQARKVAAENEQSTVENGSPE